MQPIHIEGGQLKPTAPSSQAKETGLGTPLMDGTHSNNLGYDGIYPWEKGLPAMLAEQLTYTVIKIHPNF